MTAAFLILWTDGARQDVVSIADYIEQEAPLAAMQLLDIIEAKVGQLSLFPKRGRKVPELRDIGMTTTRELIVKQWRVIYRVVDKQIYVLAVIDARRKVEDILFAKLLRH